MTERNCGTCRHFVRIESAATGHCTNPLVVSHQGQLVMYRAGEIGCRRGWKQDLWEAADGIDDSVAAAPSDEQGPDYGRAAAWADSAPTRPTSAGSILQPDALDDEDLLDPRRTRDIKEAMRRAREMKKREQMSASSREPFDQPILHSDGTPGEDAVLHVQPAPAQPPAQPMLPPVSTDEVRRRVDEMRRARRYNDPPPSIAFDQYDEHFNERADLPIVPDMTGDSRRQQSRQPIPPAPEPIAADASAELPEIDEFAETGYEFAEAEDRAYEPQRHAELSAEAAYDFVGDDAAEWPEQAPWVDDEGYDDWQYEKPKRRSWFSNLLHRQPRPQPLDPRESAFSWEPELEEIDEYPVEQPMAAEAEYVVDEPEYERQEPYAPQRGDQLPPLPYGNQEELHDDYLLADGRFADSDEEDAAARQIDHICATCRYFRPDGTCGNAFAFTYRRRVSEEYLSCSSSIGAWWLPSDHYWESIVSFTHHGQPTPLLDRYEIQADAPDTDDEVRTP